MGLNKAGKDVIAEADYESGILGQAIYTNEKVIKDWNIKKVSSSDPKLVLVNAQFKLQSTTGSTAYYGKSDKNGIVSGMSMRTARRHWRARLLQICINYRRESA